MNVAENCFFLDDLWSGLWSTIHCIRRLYLGFIVCLHTYYIMCGDPCWGERGVVVVTIAMLELAGDLTFFIGSHIIDD